MPAEGQDLLGRPEGEHRGDSLLSGGVPRHGLALIGRIQVQKVQRMCVVDGRRQVERRPDLIRSEHAAGNLAIGPHAR